MRSDDEHSKAAGLAALSACEAVILALVEEDIVSKEELERILGDAIEAHRDAGEDSPVHCRAAQLLETIIMSLNAADRKPRYPRVPRLSSRRR